jgi:hypothetical protein
MRAGLAAATALVFSAMAQAGPTLFFDDFSHPSLQALQTQGQWRLRTAPGHPGVPGARWGGISLVDDPARPGNRLLRLSAQTDGTPEGTQQAQVCHQRKVLIGTSSARVRFSAAPVSGVDGDPIVQTFYQVAPLRFDYDPQFSELDFEHLPNGGWGSPLPRLYAITWQTVRLEPWDAHNHAVEKPGALNGWHVLTMQVAATGRHQRTRHYLDGRLIAEATGRHMPVVPMSLNFNLWFSAGGLLPPSPTTSPTPRMYVQDVDWVLHVPGASRSPAQMQAQVQRLRRAGVAQRDTVPAPEPPLPGGCDF